MPKTTKYFKDMHGYIYTLPSDKRLALRWYSEDGKWNDGSLGYAWSNEELRRMKAVEITEQDALKHMGLTAFPGTEPPTPKSKLPEHTPTPWYFVPTGDRMKKKYCQPFGVTTYEKNPTLIAGVFGDVRGGESVAKTNAHHIVHCVNNHDALVEALGIAESALKAVIDKWSPNSIFNHLCDVAEAAKAHRIVSETLANAHTKEGL